jgi:hypothetical protein
MIRHLVVAAVIGIACLAGSAGADASDESFAHFHGYACVDANCREGIFGKPVVATVNGVICAETTTGYPVSDGTPVSLYGVFISTECAEPGDTVEFTIGGRKAKQTGEWSPGDHRLDIWVGADFAAYSGSLTCRNGQSCFACFAPCPTTAVRAYVDGRECGYYKANGWLVVSYFGPLVVLPESFQSPCGREGSTVTFTMDGYAANETAVWSPGFHFINLGSYAPPAGEVQLPTPTPPFPTASPATAPAESPTVTPNQSPTLQATSVAPAALPVAGGQSSGRSGALLLLAAVPLFAVSAAAFVTARKRQANK